MSKYNPISNPKIFSDAEKNSIRNQWCEQLCNIYNLYFKHGKITQIAAPLYTAQVLSTFGLLDFGKIDFSESKINFGESSTRTNNENLIYECFDSLIEKKVFIGDYLSEFRGYYNTEKMPF